jgi:predicted nucleic acid-binding protein
MKQKPKTIILDSSVWIALMISHDCNHHFTKVLLANIEAACMKILMPEIIFFEVVTVLLKVKAYDLVGKFINLQIPILRLSKKQFLTNSLKLCDIIKTKTQDFLILLYCIEYNVDSFKTFDKQQKANYILIQENENKN